MTTSNECMAENVYHGAGSYVVDSSCVQTSPLLSIKSSRRDPCKETLYFLWDSISNWKKFLRIGESMRAITMLKYSIWLHPIRSQGGGNAREFIFNLSFKVSNVFLVYRVGRIKTAR